MNIDNITKKTILYLIGWGALIEGKTFLIERDILQSLGKKKIHILMINYAHSTNKQDYMKKFEQYYSISFPEYVITFTQLQITDTWELMSKKFNTADIIYLGWWSTIRLYNTLKKYSIYEEILEQMKKGKTVVGRSAWALIFSDFYLTGSKDKTMQLRKGFWLIPCVMCAHFMQWGKEKIFLEKIAKKKTLWLGIDEGAAVKITNNSIKGITTSWSSIHTYNSWYQNKVPKKISIDEFFSFIKQ